MFLACKKSTKVLCQVNDVVVDAHVNKRIIFFSVYSVYLFKLTYHIITKEFINHIIALGPRRYVFISAVGL